MLRETERLCVVGFAKFVRVLCERAVGNEESERARARARARASVRAREIEREA